MWALAVLELTASVVIVRLGLNVGLSADHFKGAVQAIAGLSMTV